MAAKQNSSGIGPTVEGVVIDGGEIGSITWIRKRCNPVSYDRQSVQSFVNANDNTPVMEEMAIAA